METGTNQQNIENPLFLLPLFGKDIFVLKSDIQSLPVSTPKQKVKILNLFVDSGDSVFSDSTRVAYEKLMTNLKLEGLPLQFVDVAMMNAQNSIKIKSLSPTKGMVISADFWDEFDAEYCVLWSDNPLLEPAMKHYSMSNFNNSKLIFLPGFNSMLSSTELKKNVWIAFKQLLGFV